MIFAIAFTCVLSCYNQEPNGREAGMKFENDLTQNRDKDSAVVVLSAVEFYDDNYQGKALAAIRFRVTIINNTQQPIPDLSVFNRSKYLNLIVNGDVDNPMTLYNGIEVPGSDNKIQ